MFNFICYPEQRIDILNFADPARELWNDRSCVVGYTEWEGCNFKELNDDN